VTAIPGRPEECVTVGVGVVLKLGVAPAVVSRLAPEYVGDVVVGAEARPSRWPSRWPSSEAFRVLSFLKKPDILDWELVASGLSGEQKFGSMFVQVGGCKVTYFAALFSLSIFIHLGTIKMTK
jgi:hypothetical protein